MEVALAHVVRNEAEAAYARSDLFEKRRALSKRCERTTWIFQLDAGSKFQGRSLWIRD